MSTSSQVFRNSLAHRAFALFVLVNVLLASTPFPVALKPKIAGGERFPCQACNCGCTTAEQCWTSCCCFSPSQRLDWAEKNNVTPPGYAVLNEDPNPGSGLQEFSNADEAAACCCACGVDVRRGAEPQADCSDTVDSAVLHSKSGFSGHDERNSVLVVSLTAVKCRGAATDFTLLPWAIVSPVPVSCVFPEPVVQPHRPWNDRFYSNHLAPDTPPPRQFVLSV